MSGMTYYEAMRMYFPSSCELPENYEKHEWLYTHNGYSKKRICQRCGLIEYAYGESSFHRHGLSDKQEATP